MAARPGLVPVAAAPRLNYLRVFFTRFLLYLGTALGLSSCREQLYDKQLRLLYQDTIPRITPRQLIVRQTAGEKIYLLDTRSEPEYAVSHLPGARFLNYKSFHSDQVRDIPAAATVVVYCTIGVRSEKAGLTLKKAGYQHVYNLYGGIIYWQNKGFGLTDKNNNFTARVHTYNRYWSVWLTNGVKVYD